jgi:hypothetical protein
MNDAPLVSVVIVTYGTGPIILEAIEAVERHTTISYEIVVVDNPPNDERPRVRGAARVKPPGSRSSRLARTSDSPAATTSAQLALVVTCCASSIRTSSSAPGGSAHSSRR